MHSIVWTIMCSLVLLPIIAGSRKCKTKTEGIAISVLLLFISAAAYLSFRHGILTEQIEEDTMLAAFGINIFRLSRANLLFTFIHSLVLLAVRISIPKSKNHLHSPLFFITAGANGMYLLENPLLMIPCWIINYFPVLNSMKEGSVSRKIFGRYQLVGFILFAIGMVNLQIGGVKELSITALTIAIFIRQGLFPFHSWVLKSFEDSELPLWINFITSQIGAYLFYSNLYPLLEVDQTDTFPLLTALNLISALYLAFLAQIQRRVRTALGLYMLSQSTYIIAGLEMRALDGIGGGMLHFTTLSLGFTGLILCLWHLERRTGMKNIFEYRGYYSLMPYLAILFLLFGMTTVGLPLTLGYITEDILFHSVVEHYPWLGIMLIITTAMNATTLFRIFFHLFYGTAATDTYVSDLNASEKRPLVILFLILIFFGVAPKYLIIEHGYHEQKESQEQEQLEHSGH